MKRLFFVLLIVSLVFILYNPLALAAKSQNNQEILWLDSHANINILPDPWIWHINELPRVTSQMVLESGKYYMVTISGTYSWFANEYWTTPLAEPQPMFLSSGVPNGKVGQDTEFFFAFPAGWPNPEDPLPCSTQSVQVSLDCGVNWVDKTEYRSNDNYKEEHSYNYVFKGQGYPFTVLIGDQNYNDNYGMLKIKIHALGKVERTE